MTRIAPALVATSLAGAILLGALFGETAPVTATGVPGPGRDPATASPAPVPGSGGADPGALRSTAVLDPSLAAGTPGEVLVIGRPAAPGKPAAAAVSGLDSAGALRELAGRRRISVAGLSSLAPSIVAREAFPGGAWVLRYDGAESPETVAARLREDPSVLYAGPNHLLAVTGRPYRDAGAAVTSGPFRDGGAAVAARAHRDAGAAVTAGALAEGAREARAGPSVAAGGRETRAGPSAAAGRLASHGPSVAGEDSLRSEQYALDMVGAPAAWESSRGEGILVAVIDTGVDVTHPDLAANIHINVAERDGLAGVDDDGNGYVDDITGYDFTDAAGLPGVGDYLERDPDPSDEYGHGTQVAGVIAAVEGNRIGVAGLAPDAEILALRAGFNTGLPFLPALLQEDDAAAAVLYAVDNGARILNLSWGDLVEAPLLEAVVRYARERGVLVVAGAGNDTGDLAFYPAAYAGVVSAGACDRDGVRANFSTYGQDLDLLAPGVGLWTTSPGGDYAERTGTSFSSPMTAAAAALVWSVRPEWTADQVAWQLRVTAQRETAGWAAGRGWGILDAAAAVSGDELPPVVQVEAVHGSEPLLGKPFTPTALPEYTVSGTAAVSGLNRWTLSVMPESIAVNAGPAGPESEVAAERILVRDASRQVVAESLATFVPGPTWDGPWIARMRAWAGGWPVIEKRLRFEALSTAPDVGDLTLELQVSRERGRHLAGSVGWDLVATWGSDARYRGSIRLQGTGTEIYTAEETSVGTHHAVRLAGPLPVGAMDVQIMGRGAANESGWILVSRTLDIPAIHALFGKSARDWPSGTPMRRSADWNNNGLPEFFVEAAPTGGYLYGPVERYEATTGVTDFGVPERLDSSEGIYRGIPVDFADSDGDSLRELVVFRLDGWEIYEEDAGGGEVPTRKIFEQGSGTPVPVAFAGTSAGTVLVAVSGGGLAVYARDAENHWGLASDAPASDIGLQHGGVIEDMDGDGVTDAFFADAYGRLFWFTIEGATVRYAGQRPVPVPLAGAMLAVPGDGGRLDLLTTEVDPQTPEFEGDLDRAAVRVRRWAWDGIHLTQRDSLAFGGLTAAGDVWLRRWRDKALLVRETDLDVIGLEDGELQAGGGISATGNLSRVDGVSVAPLEFQLPQFGDLLWLGNARVEEPGLGVEIGERAGQTTVGGPPLRVTHAEADGDSLDLILAWDDDGCPDSGSLWKSVVAGGTDVIPTTDRHAVDRVALGDRVIYQTLSGICAPRSAEVLAAAPQVPGPVWDGPERLVLAFDPPLHELPMEIALRRNGLFTTLPTAVSLDRSGTRLLVAVPGEPPDGLRITGAWDTDGLPIGGAETWTVDVPTPPAPVARPVLAAVTYSGRGEPLLEVTVSGGVWTPGCNEPFRLEPVGWDLEAQPAPGEAAAPLGAVSTTGAPAGASPSAAMDPLPSDLSVASLPGATSQVFAVPLPSKLSPGRYTLSLRDDCLSPEERGPGQELVFHVGIRVYPNPLQPGDRLTVNNLEIGSRVTLVDVSGREILGWRVESFTETRDVSSVAPGLYFLRLESPDGRFLSHEKLVILQ